MTKRRGPSAATTARITEAAAARLAPASTEPPPPMDALPQPPPDLFTKRSAFLDTFGKTNEEAIRASWRWFYAEVFRIAARLPDDDLRGRLSAAITLGICTDKIQLLDGKPTQSVLNVHELRGSFPDLVRKLAGLRAAVEFQSADPPVPLGGSHGKPRK